MMVSKKLLAFAAFLMIGSFSAFGQENGSEVPVKEEAAGVEVLEEKSGEEPAAESSEDNGTCESDSSLVLAPAEKVYSYDESSTLFLYFNNMSREDFEIVKNLGTVQEQTIFEMVGFLSSFSTFIQVDMDTMDENEKNMYDFVVSGITKKFKENDVVLSIVINQTDLLNGTMEGWGIISHMANENDVQSLIYYFTAEF